MRPDTSALVASTFCGTRLWTFRGDVQRPVFLGLGDDVLGGSGPVLTNALDGRAIRQTPAWSESEMPGTHGR